MKEQRKGALARVGDLAETLAAGAKRRAQAREPRVLQPGMKDRDELVELAERMVELATQP